MRLFMFEKDGERGLAKAEGNMFRGLALGHKDCPGDLDFILGSGFGLEKAGQLLAEAPELDPSGIVFCPPLARPGKIICLGMNYKAHTEEFKRQAPKYPELFVRFPTTLVGHLRPIIKPVLSDQLDYEGEMAAVIGKAGR